MTDGGDEGRGTGFEGSSSEWQAARRKAPNWKQLIRDPTSMIIAMGDGVTGKQAKREEEGEEKGKRKEARKNMIL